MWNEIFDGIGPNRARSCCWPKQHPLLCSILLSFVGLWLENDVGTKQHVPNWILCKLESSRSKSTTCQRKGCLLRFELNSTAGSAQRLGNDVWQDSELIATKICSPIGSKWNATCPKKGRLLRFEMNSTATSDGCTQKLGNNVWQDFELITTKVCK